MRRAENAARRRGSGPDGGDMADRRVDAARCERRDDHLALPGEIRRRAQMLHGAAAAMGEVTAHRRDALRARLDDGDEARALAAHVGLHALAR